VGSWKTEIRPQFLDLALNTELAKVFVIRDDHVLLELGLNVETIVDS